VQFGTISKFGLMEMSRQRLRPALSEGASIPCPRCGGSGHVRDTESSALQILRIIQEESMKDNTAAVYAQVPVEVASFLLNEKRTEIAKIEIQQRLNVLLVPNKTLETPNYKLERLKHDDPRLDRVEASYKMAEEFEDPTAVTRRSQEPTNKQTPVIKGVLPDAPAPAHEPKPAAPAKAPAHARGAKPAAKAAEAKSGGLWGWFTGLFSSDSEEKAKPAVGDKKPMAEAAVVVAVAVVVTVPSAVSALKVKVATLKAATSATPKVLRPVANAQRVASVPSALKAVAAKAAAHVKTATVVDAAKAAMVKPVTPKAKQPSTTTPHLKPKPKHAPKHATNAWPVKSVAKALKVAMSNANLALSAANVVIAQNVVKVAKAVANAAHAASATKVAVNAPLAWTRTATPKPCHSTTQQLLKAKHRKPTRMVASVVSAAHATVTAVTAASVATAHRVKKVLQNTPTTAHLLSTTTQHMTTLHTSQLHKKPASHVSHANRVNHASNANLVVSAKSATSALTVHLATHRAKRHSKLHPWHKPQRPLACHAFKASRCHWLKCKPWRKAAVWNGSTPIQTASQPCKLPSQPSQSQYMCHASAHRW
jgi:hypothetical protein